MWDVDTMSVIKNVGYEIYVQPYAGSMLASGHETTATLLKEALILMVQ